MGFYDEMQAIGTELLTEFNQGSIVLMKRGVASGPAWSPTHAADTPTPLKGGVKGVSFQYVQKGLAIESDKQVTCAIPTVMPTMEDYLSIDGVRFKIVHIAKIPEAGTPVVLNIVCRAG